MSHEIRAKCRTNVIHASFGAAKKLVKAIYSLLVDFKLKELLIQI